MEQLYIKYLTFTFIFYGFTFTRVLVQTAKHTVKKKVTKF